MPLGQEKGISMRFGRIFSSLAAVSILVLGCSVATGCAPEGSAAAEESGGQPAVHASLPDGWSQLKVGMSQKEVYDLLGLPVRVERAGKTLTAVYRFGSVVFEGADGFGYSNKGALRTWKAK